ncbi:MAG: alpha-N-arabinofuranosidase [Acidobacteria bacterium]|nr:MAG: alpha-N-arabinofuranosidase [Acidobacteriota bacterium]
MPIKLTPLPRSRSFVGRLVCVAVALTFSGLAFSGPAKLTVQADKPGLKIDPIFYGLMTEEINYSYDGGLYGELIRNRIFQDRPIVPRGPRPTATNPPAGQPGATPVPAAPAAPPPAEPTPPANPAVAKNPHLINWWLVTSDGAAGEIDIDTTDPVNKTALKNSLRLDIRSVNAGQRVGVANDGYWGIPVRPNTTYRASFYARASREFKGPLTVSIEGLDGQIYVSGRVGKLTPAWKKYTLKLKTRQVRSTAEARFVLSASSPGSVWFCLVSLFPPTYKNRENGNRIDIMEKLAAMKPSFLRFPGGNYLEGRDFESRFNWIATIGPLEERPGHMSPWNYRSSDGVGLLEFLNWCEDLDMEPIVGVYAGLHLDQGRTTITGEALKPFVQEALEEIEYITGDKSTKWGALRAKHGHPAPFKLRYVEIGNEDFLNNGKESYAGRFSMFYDAIKAKYPNIQVISSLRSWDHYDHTRPPDLLDDHFYVSLPTALSNAHYYDKYDRSAEQIFVGEWATNNPRGGPTGHMAFALGDAAWLTGLERNADVIVMNAYAPLFCNVNPGGMQWSINLIGYDALGSFGSPAYWVQQMFSNNRGDVVLTSKLDPLPTLTAEQLPKATVTPGGRPGGPGARPPTVPPGPFDAVYATASRENASGDIILKLVNIQGAAQTLQIGIEGVAKIAKEAKGEVLSAELDGMNSVAEPAKVAPKPVRVTNAGTSFTHDLPAYSVTVLRLKTR